MSRRSAVASAQSPHTFTAPSGYRRQLRGERPALAFCVIGGKRVYLGEYGTPESVERFHRAQAEAVSGLPAPGEVVPDLALAELIRLYASTIAEAYGPSTVASVRVALRRLRKLYGSLPVREFGPGRFLAYRDALVDEGLSRSTVRKYELVVKNMLAWAVTRQLADPQIVYAIRTVKGLRKGRSAAKESDPVRPAKPEQVEAALKHLTQPTAAMVRLQLLTGCRPGEIVGICPRDVERTADDVWHIRPERHKNAWREGEKHERVIALGPRAIEVLRPFLDRPADQPCFSPREANAEARSRNAKTKRREGQPESRRKSDRRTRDVYSVDSYRRAIERACDAAFPPPEPLAQREDESESEWMARLTAEQKEELRAWREAHRWTPHQLRHAAGTKITNEHGIEMASLMLGHKSLRATAIYAERDRARLSDLARKVG